MIILVIAGLVVIAGIIYFFVVDLKKNPIGGNNVEQNVTDNETNKTGEQKIDKTDQKVILPEVTPEEVLAQEIRLFSTSFVERFGTYSNVNFQNVVEGLYPQMSGTFINWIKTTYLPDLQKNIDPKGFAYKIVTQGPAVEIIQQSEKSAKVKVETQREEKSMNETKTFLQDIELTLIKSNDNWLVDAAYWKDKR